MKKSIALVLFCISLISCQQEAIKKENYKKIDNLLNITFKDSFPSFINNNLVFNKAYEFLKANKDSILENKVLDDLALEIFKIYKNPQGKGAIIHFVKHPENNYHSFDQSTDTIFSNFVTYDLLAITSEKEAEKYTNGQKFYVKSNGPYIDINAAVDIFTNQTYYTNSFDLKYSMRELNINYGILFTEIDSLIPFNNRLNN